MLNNQLQCNTTAFGQNRIYDKINKEKTLMINEESTKAVY